MPAQPDRDLIAGRYRKDGLLGQGGMSRVYYGYDERLDRRVAIKELKQPAALLPNGLPAARDSPEAIEVFEELERNQKRFLREIRTMAGLEMSGIPAVYDTGVEHPSDGPPVLWLVMQLLRGTTLEALLGQVNYETEPLAVTKAAAITAQIAAVLTDVHRLDIVHRDIKPANIMVTDGGLVKVLDFGISILLGAGALPRLTQVGHTVGTPLYMPPEQWQGQLVTAASDIYSLGCILTELLTGDPPFPVKGDALRAAHLTASAPSPGSVRGDLPPGLDALTASMLDKNPDARPSAVQVYNSLLPFIGSPHSSGGLAVTASGAAIAPGDRDPVRPFRSPLLSPEPGPAVRPGQTADQGSLTDAEAGQILDAAAAYLKVDRPSDAVRVLDEGVVRARHDKALQLYLRHRLGNALFAAGEYSRAATVLDSVRGDLQAQARREPSDQDVLECAYQAGLAYAETGKPAKALYQLLFYIEHAKPDENPAEFLQVLQTRFIIAQLRAADGHPDEALDDLRAIRPSFVSVYGADSTQVRNLDKQARRLGL
jgi:serine/threonine protein kinase